MTHIQNLLPSTHPDNPIPIVHNLSIKPPSPLHTKPCPSDTLSRTKPSVRSPTSFATTATTGMNSAPTQPIPHGKPRKLPPHPSNCQNTRPLKTKDFLPLNHYYSRTRLALCSSPSNIPTSGGCTRKPKHPSGQQKRSTSWQTSRIGTDYLPMNALCIPCSCILCCLWWNCQQGPEQQFFRQSDGTQSLMLLWLPNCSGKHPQQNLLTSHWHLHQGPDRETTPAPCHQNSTMCLTQSKLGPWMVQPHSH